ncbi:MAG: pseudouridine-5'-phosphate glycosidase [Saprospiraceae bacterium]
MLAQYLDISPTVQEALKTGKPVVALESTIIAHGMPYPQNKTTAIEVENIIRSHGAVPASIAIINGKLKAGLSTEEIDLLAKSGSLVPKASRRDIPFLVAKKSHGATTVASTMIIANLAGIHFFATGGIGGVHRGATETMDISADLQELARTNVAVVSAGAKSILDLALTLEYLETQGVPVVGYQTKEFPAFYTRKSGLNVDYKVDQPLGIAQALRAKWDLGINGGVLIANPIPTAAQMEFEPINQAIELAIAEVERIGIKGKETTPFLLSKIEKLTKGASLKANIQLVFNNAKLAAQIAKAYSEMLQA